MDKYIITIKDTINKALIITSDTALNGFISGASIRTDTIRELLESLNLEVEVIALKDFLKIKSKNYRIIALTPFTSSRAAKKARSLTDILWFDACDSWWQTRISRFVSGEGKQIVAFAFDMIRNSSHPRFDLITFISANDSDVKRFFYNYSDQKPFILPNHFEKLVLKHSASRRLVFIGDGAYGPNKKAIHFLKKVARIFDDEMKIYIVGKGFRHLPSKFVGLGYLAPGDLYYEGDVHLAPIFTGAGIKNKVAIPLGLGLKVVTTTHGANGLLPDENLFIANNAEDFAKKVFVALSSQNESHIEKRIYCDDDTQMVVTHLKFLLTSH